MYMNKTSGLVDFIVPHDVDIEEQAIRKFSKVNRLLQVVSNTNIIVLSLWYSKIMKITVA